MVPPKMQRGPRIRAGSSDSRAILWVGLGVDKVGGGVYWSRWSSGCGDVKVAGNPCRASPVCGTGFFPLISLGLREDSVSRNSVVSTGTAIHLILYTVSKYTRSLHPHSHKHFTWRREQQQ